MLVMTKTLASVLEALAPYPYVIFDMDGTLLDSEPRHADAWNEVASRHPGIAPITYEYLSRYGGIPTAQIAKMICKENNVPYDSAALAQEKMDAYRKVHMHKAQCFDDMARLVFALKERGVKIAVATGSLLPETRELLDKFKLTPCLETIVSADQVEHGKPAPDTYLEAARRMGAKPSECAVFEDTPIGHRGVKAAGMDLIKVKNGRILTSVIKNAAIVID